LNLKQIDTAQWDPIATRREFFIGANLIGLGSPASARRWSGHPEKARGGGAAGHGLGASIASRTCRR
jgi:hypothetical protein